MNSQAYTRWLQRAGRPFAAALAVAQAARGTRAVLASGAVRAGAAGAIIALCLGSAAAVAATPERELVVVVDTGTEMPMAAFKAGQLTDGIHKDLGLALAHQLGRKAVFLSLPRKRVAMALEAGKADLICLYMPAWLPGKFAWSVPFYPMTEVIVSDTTGPQPHALGDLYGVSIATVLGYYHPELEQALGAGFVREDGPSSSNNLRKMSIGRVHHAVTQLNTLNYYQKVGPHLDVYPPLVLKTYQAQCAVAERSQVRVGDVNRAIKRLIKDGSLYRIISAYQ